MAEEITVRGYAEQRTAPDRATLRVTGSGEGADRRAAYQVAADQARAIDEVVEAHRASLGRINHTALIVQPKSRWSREGEETPVGWSASRTTLIEVTDLDRVGDLMAELTAAASVVAGPTWELNAANPVHAVTRRAAAENARARAEDYATALGLRLLGVAWVAEPGIRHGGDPVPQRAFAMRAKAPASASAGPDRTSIDMTPDELTVSAAVDVGFHVSAVTS